MASPGIRQPLSRDEVLRIARVDADRAYRDLSRYRISIALEADGWHVDFELKNDPMSGGGPHYLIDPDTASFFARTTSNDRVAVE